MPEGESVTKNSPFFSKQIVFPKLEVNAPGDSFEREADVMADRIVSGNTQDIQRACAACEEETPHLMRKASTAGFEVSPEISAQIQQQQGMGQSLPGSTLNAMNQAFRNDFSEVKIHSDAPAAAISEQLRAKAFTFRNDIFFNRSQYQPESSGGKRLLAHELTHVAQQRRAPNPSSAPVFRKPSDAEVETEFNTWATGKGKKIDKSSEDYPHDLWDFVYAMIADPDTAGPIAKPADAKGAEEWKKKFEKSEIVAQWLFNLKSSSKSDDIKSTAESRGYGILDLMARAGFIAEAMSKSSNLGDKNKGFLFDTILKNPGAVAAGDLETIVTFQCNGVTDAASVPIVQTLTDGSKGPLKKLDTARTKAILKILFTKYPSSDVLVNATAEILLFNPGIRNDISDAMMKSEFGTPEILFKILKHPYFIEPEYGADIPADSIPAGKTAEEADALRWTTDMPWVYKYKQQYYVKYLIDLAKGQGIDIPQPASMDFAGLKPWLDANTEKIGEAAKKKYPSDPGAVFEIYRNITDIFFYHIPHDRDAVPDLEGKISHLKAGQPSKMRFEADCDVFATYAMRLFFNAGFEPIGYLAYVPSGNDSSRAAHVTALMRKDNAYYIINNKGILDPTLTETTPNEKKLDAMKAMRRMSFEDAYGDPRPTDVKIYYQDAGAKGQMTNAFKNQDSSLERTDL